MSRIYHLLHKFALGTCSSEEFDELMYLLQQQGNEQDLRSSLRKIYDSLDMEVISESSVNAEGVIVQEEPATSTKRYPSFFRKKWAVAAGVLLCVGLATWTFVLRRSFYSGGDEQVSRVITPAGSKTSVVLPDGTTVWLNSKSSLTYTTGFVDGRREVTLVGEAMFDVKHDSLHPFLVHTENFDVTDLGTVFNIQAYPEDRRAEASLISGSIEVALKKRHSKKIMLVPNQRMVVQNGQMTVRNTQKDKDNDPVVKPIIPDPQTRIVPDTAWMVNKLIFKDEDFGDLSMQLQRRYNVEISFGDKKCSEYKFTGRFEDETIDEALQELQVIAPFTYKREKNQVYITN